jgi:hypothetical protein
MTILRWALIAAICLGFLLMSVANWTIVPFVLPDGEAITVALPLLLAAAFLAGWLPTWAWHMASRTRRPTGEKTSRLPTPAPGTAGLCDQAQPTIVPPAGA